jgi:hypothetical protein
MLPSVKKILPVTLVTLTMFTGCKSENLECPWTKEPIKIDGQAADWTNLPKLYFKDYGASIGVCNDADNLYVLFRFNNHQWLPLLRNGGLTIWLDKTAKDKKDFGIRYFGKLPFDSTQISRWHHRRPGMESNPEGNMPPRLERTIEEIIVLNGKNQINSISPDGSYGVYASIGQEEGIFSYEFAIPIRNLDPLKYNIGSEPGRKVSLGFEITGMDRGDFESPRGERGDAMGGGGGGMPPEGGMPPGGGMGPSGGMGPGMGRRQGPMTPMTEGEKIWVKTTLTLPPIK